MTAQITQGQTLRSGDEVFDVCWVTISKESGGYVLK